MTRTRRINVWCGALVLVSVAVAQAHEFWIDADNFHPAANGLVRLTLSNGERFAGVGVPRDSLRIQSFQNYGPASMTPVVGREGGAVNYARVSGPGTYVIAYRSRPTPHELPAIRFESYLQEEGLGAALAERTQRGESGKIGKELYTRCAKALLQVGSVSSEQPDRIVGLPLEILMEQCAAEPNAESTANVRVFFRGAPLADANLVAVNKAAPSTLMHVVTGADGRARITLPRGGVWMVTTIHMVRAAADGPADWESFWASLTFQVGTMQSPSAKTSAKRR